MEFVDPIRILRADKKSKFLYCIDPKKRTEKKSWNRTRTAVTTIDDASVKNSVLEHILCWYSLSLSSKNIRNMASYIPITARAEPKETTTVEMSFNQKYVVSGISPVTTGSIISGMIFPIIPPKPYTIKFVIKCLIRSIRKPRFNRH